MPVVVTKTKEREGSMTASWAEAGALHRPLTHGSLVEDVRGTTTDSEVAAISRGFAPTRRKHKLRSVNKNGRGAVEYKHQAWAFFGIGSFNKEVAKLAAEGWEPINGAHGGTTIHAFMRRRLAKPANAAAAIL